jgi:hypothetical protein
LSEAREAAPRSLLQDRAMLDLNAIALEICRDKWLRSDVVSRMAAVADAARRTRDLRFVQVAEWFAGCLELAVSGTGGPPAALRQKVERMRASERVAIEVFIPKHFDTVALDVPFVLSPHWRY